MAKAQYIMGNGIVHSTDTDITIPARAIVCQLGLPNMISKLIYPGDDYENESEELDDSDEGLTYSSV